MHLNSRVSYLSITFAVGLCTITAVFAKSDHDGHRRHAAKALLIAERKTEKYIEKEGFERQRKDIVNTLKDNDVTRFATLQDALVQAFDLDKTLKNKGPYTLFAPSDRGFKRLPSDDLQALMANKKKLRQVLEYHIVQGNLDAEALKSRKKVKTLEGHEITISDRGGSIYADDVLIKTVDMPCSNGMIHVLDGVVMPPLSK